MGVKLGQKWAVKDGNLLASNQVGSRFFNKEFDFSRASNGTYVDRDGLLKTAELYNLMPYSEDFSQWTTQSGITLEQTTETYDPNGQYNAYKVISTNPSSGFYRTGLSMNFDVTRSIYLKGVNGGETCQFKDGSGNGGLLNLTLTNEWVRYEFTTLYSGGTFQGMFIDDISSDIYVYGAQLVEGTEPLDYQYTNGLQGLPRISFEDGVGHLLLEPQTSQILPYSEDFSTYAFTGTITLESGYLAPDGTNTAYKIINGGSGAIYDPAIVIYNSTRSIYARSVSGTGTAQLLSHNSNTNNTFTLTEQWQRFEVNSAIGVGVDNFYAVDFRGGGTLNEIIIWGANATNNQTYPTSYIKTEGTAVTRLADVCNNSGSAQDFNSEEGVLYFEGANIADDSVYKAISIGSGSGNFVMFRYRNSPSSVQAYIYDGSVAFLQQRGGVDVTSFNKFAIRYSQTEQSFWINGVKQTLPISGDGDISNLNLTSCVLGGIGGAYSMYGKVRNLQVFTEALSDTELISLTGGNSSASGLLASYISRVEADGGTVEAQTCVKNELIELL